MPTLPAVNKYSQIVALSGAVCGPCATTRLHLPLTTHDMDIAGILYDGSATCGGITLPASASSLFFKQVVRRLAVRLRRWAPG
jgi:hypothetical protein